MLTLLLIFAIIIGIVLIAVVLIQNPKGSGLAANFSTGNQFFGVKKTTDIVEKITWVTASLVIVISLISTGFLPKNNSKVPNQGTKNGKIDPQLEEIMDKGLPPATPTMPSTPESNGPQTPNTGTQPAPQPAPQPAQ
ncbi:MAG: preprotein translocase subunit SecG [Bacteroidetes bacterium]|nr:preprotein translocase subunit SecG [Bacteroidota bacterium]